MGAPKYRNIAIIRLSSLGDIIHTIPAFNVLRKQFPHARLSWIAEPAGAKLLENVSGIDEIISINIKVKGIINKIKEILRIRSLYRNHFDLIFDFQGLFKSAILGWILKGVVVGFDKVNLKEPLARFFYDKQVKAFDENTHVIYKNLHLVNEVVSIPNPLPVEYPLMSLRISKNLEEFFSKNQLKEKNYIILNIGGGWESKLLQKEQYLDLINQFKGKFREKVVILWGNNKEQGIALDIARKSDTIIAEFLNFSELILFIKNSRVIVTADTLALHVADMVKTPSVAFFGPTSPWRNGSLLEYSVSVFEKTACSFCYKKKCDKIECIKKLNLEEIIIAIGKINEKCYRNNN